MPPIRPLSRRSFLRRTAASALLLGAPACGADEEADGLLDAGEGDADVDAGDGGAGDTGSADGGSGSADAGASDGSGGADGGGASEPIVAEAAAMIARGPWTVVGASGGLELLLDRVGADAGGMTLETRQGEASWTSRAFAAEPAVDIPYRWPPSEAFLTDYPDLPGTYTVMRAALGGLEAGVRVQWRVRVEGLGIAAEGEALAPPAPGAALRFVWFADTMVPRSVDVSTMVQQHEFDFVVHGGDIQYRSAVVDTWTGMFANFGPLMRRAPMFFVIGNHEFEATDESGDETDLEFTTTYQRLFKGQGEVGTDAYYAFTWGALRFIVLNSEEVGFEAGSAQDQWVRAELARAQNDPAIEHIVVGFHRPFFTLSSSKPDIARRELLHSLFVASGVRLVLTGHNHCYERFEVDGITYIVDGGGGALPYLHDEHAAEIEAERPGEGALRRVGVNAYGATFVSIAPDGTIAVVRRDIDGDETDRFEIARA